MLALLLNWARLFSSVGKNAFKVGNATKYAVVNNGFDLSGVIDSDNIA